MTDRDRLKKVFNARYECGLSCHHKFGCGDCFFTREAAEKELERR